MGIFSDLDANAHLTTPLKMLPASKFMVPNWSEGPTSMNHQDGQHITTGDRTFYPQGDHILQFIPKLQY